MKKIPLSQGKFALVDDEDFEELNKFKWYAHSNNKKNYYAVRNISLKNKRSAVKMHQVILTEKNIDHINTETLDNRRSNLRAASLSQNAMNRKKRVDNKSGFKGVSKTNKTSNKFVARITIKGKTIVVCYSTSKIVCAKAYNDAALKHHGEFALLNKLD